MQTATVSPSDFDVLTMKAQGSMNWIVVAYRGWIIEHSIAQYPTRSSGGDTMDFTKDAPSIGLTIRQFTKQQPNYKPNDFHALMYFFGREPYLETYIASRLELMKEITADRHIPSKLIRRLMEAK